MKRSALPAAEGHEFPLVEAPPLALVSPITGKVLYEGPPARDVGERSDADDPDEMWDNLPV